VRREDNRRVGGGHTFSRGSRGRLSENHARPIPVDKRLVEQDAVRLDRALRLHLEERERRLGDWKIGATNPGWPLVEIAAQHLAELREVRKGSARTLSGLRLEVRSRDSDRPSVFLGGQYEGGRDPRIVFVLNGARTPAEVLKYDVLGYVAKVLLHEVTHAIDVLPRESSSQAQRYAEATESIRIGAAGQREFVAYYNDPMEVRAFMQMVVDEARQIGPRLRFPRGASPRFYVEAVLRQSPTWTTIEPHLRRENYRRILKAVVTALEQTPGTSLHTTTTK